MKSPRIGLQPVYVPKGVESVETDMPQMLPQKLPGQPYRVLKHNRKVQPKLLNNFARFIVCVKVRMFTCRRLISISQEILKIRNQERPTERVNQLSTFTFSSQDNRKLNSDRNLCQTSKAFLEHSLNLFKWPFRSASFKLQQIASEVSYPTLDITVCLTSFILVLHD